MKKRVFVVIGILAAAGIGGGLFWRYRGNFRSASDDSVAYVSSVGTITGNIAGVLNRYAGVVEAQDTLEVNIENGRQVKEVQVKTGDEVKQGQLLFEYDLSSIQQDLQEENLNLERLKNEALSLQEQINTLEKEKAEASQDNQLSYTIEIETNRMNLKKNEYDQKSKEAQIRRLQEATVNTQVRSAIDGVVQKIDTTKLSSEDGDTLSEGSSAYLYSDSSDTSNAFITILSTGAYRVKGQVNEQNRNSIIPGEPVIIRSRVNEDQVWRGTMGTIDTENANSSNNQSMYYGMMSVNDSQTTSSSYPFYVELDSSDGLMLGQHVYIEPDNGQEEKKSGLWLSSFYIADVDTSTPYVWAADDNDRLEKRQIILGQYDAELEEYEIVDGLALKDFIAYPDDALQEGMRTSTSITALQESGSDPEEGMDMEGYEEGMFSEEPMMDDAAFYEEEMEEVPFVGEGMDGEDFFDDQIIEEEDSGEGFFDDTIVMDDGTAEMNMSIPAEDAG